MTYKRAVLLFIFGCVAGAMWRAVPASAQLLDLAACSGENPPADCKLAPWEKDFKNTALHEQAIKEIGTLGLRELDAFARAVSACQGEASLQTEGEACVAATSYWLFVKRRVPSPLTRTFEAVRTAWAINRYRQRLRQPADISYGLTSAGIVERWQQKARDRFAEIGQ